MKRRLFVLTHGAGIRRRTQGLSAERPLIAFSVARILFTAALILLAVPLPAPAMQVEACDYYLNILWRDGVVVDTWVSKENCHIVESGDGGGSGGVGSINITSAYENCQSTCSNPCKDSVCATKCGRQGGAYVDLEACEGCCDTKYERSTKDCGGRRICVNNETSERNACKGTCTGDVP